MLRDQVSRVIIAPADVALTCSSQRVSKLEYTFLNRVYLDKKSEVPVYLVEEEFLCFYSFNHPTTLPACFMPWVDIYALRSISVYLASLG